MKKHYIIGLLLSLGAQTYAQTNAIGDEVKAPQKNASDSSIKASQGDATDAELKAQQVNATGVGTTSSSDKAPTSTPSNTIADVRITGNTSIPLDALELNLEANGIVKGQVLDPERLEILRQHVIGHYQYFRRYLALVETRVKTLDNGQITVELYIDEDAVNQGLPAGYNDDPYDQDIYHQEPSENHEIAAHEPTDAHSDTHDGTAHESPENTVVDNNDDISSEQDEDDPNRPDSTISLGLGYGNKGTLLRASYIKRRLFDSDVSMRLSAMHDRYESNIDLGFSKPNVFKPGIRLDVNLFYDAFDNSRSRTVAPYDRRSYGLQAKLNFPIDKDSSFYTGLRYTHNRLKDIRPEYQRSLYLRSIDSQRWDFKANDLDLLLGWKYNNFNKKFLPTRGIGISIDGAASLPGSDNKYYKVQVNAEGYYPLNTAETWLLAAKTTLGYAKGMDSHEVPFYQLFTAGGTGSLRGFAYGTVGPRALYAAQTMPQVSSASHLYTQRSRHVIGGNALAAGSVELIVPSFFIPQEYRRDFRTSLFIDAASVWDTNSKTAHPLLTENTHSRRIRVSAGLSLQWQFPAGVLSLSYAVPIKKYAGDRREQLQLNISGSF